MSDTGIAKIFMHGRSQAVRLPLAFRLPGDRVRVRRVANGILLEPMVTDIDAWFAALEPTYPSWKAVANSRRCLQPRTCLRELLFDTNAIIALLKNQPPTARDRLRRVAA